MTPETHAALGRVIAFLDAWEDHSAHLGAISTLRTEGLRLTAPDLRALLDVIDPAASADHMDDSTEVLAALTAEPLTLEDTDAIRRTRDYLGVHLRVHGPDVPIATINESHEPGGFLWALTPADLGRTLVPAIPHTTYEGMQALRDALTTTTTQDGHQ